ncbi:hypothetical protein LguiA_035344 [Lonicera macranthoides]
MINTEQRISEERETELLITKRFLNIVSGSKEKKKYSAREIKREIRNWVGQI